MKIPQKKNEKLQISKASLAAMWIIGMFLFYCSLKQIQDWGLKNDDLFAPCMGFLLVWTGLCFIPYSQPMEKEEYSFDMRS